MENINTKGSATATIERKFFQPSLIIQALIFTGLLHFGVGQTSPYTTRGFELDQSVASNATLSVSVSKSVLQYASQQSGLPISDLHIVQAKQQTWSDNCLGLHTSKAVCTHTLVPGWKVAVVSSKQSWIYRTDASGSVIKMEQATSSPTKQNKQKEIAKSDRQTGVDLG